MGRSGQVSHELGAGRKGRGRPGKESRDLESGKEGWGGRGWSPGTMGPVGGLGEAEGGRGRSPGTWRLEKESRDQGGGRKGRGR